MYIHTFLLIYLKASATKFNINTLLLIVHYCIRPVYCVVSTLYHIVMFKNIYNHTADCKSQFSQCLIHHSLTVSRYNHNITVIFNTIYNPNIVFMYQFSQYSIYYFFTLSCYHHIIQHSHANWNLEAHDFVKMTVLLVCNTLQNKMPPLLLSIKGQISHQSQFIYRTHQQRGKPLLMIT